MRPRQASIHALLCTAALAISTPALSDTITVKSAGGSDTAEENIGTGAVGTSSSDLEMMTEGSEPQLVEFIFRDTDLPDDATICDAFITFTASEVNIGFDPADLTISGELTDDASDIKGGDDNLSNRAQTLATVNWQPAEWTVVDQTHQTPSLATVIQEIVDSLGGRARTSSAFSYRARAHGTPIPRMTVRPMLLSLRSSTSLQAVPAQVRRSTRIASTAVTGTGRRTCATETCPAATTPSNSA